MCPTLKTQRNVGELISAGLSLESERETLEDVSQQFSIAISPTMQQQIKRVDDPVAKQFVPTAEELFSHPDELSDPIGDQQHGQVKGIIHKYKDRCLLLPIRVCPVYCRFCFRRENIGSGNPALTPQELSSALDYIREHTEIWEVILSGGDPLFLKPKQLQNIIRELNKIDHVKVIRIHTRVPVVSPERITPALIRSLKQQKPTYVVLHANHSDEFSPEAEAACAAFVDNGIPMLSQSVLLNGVNADLDSLKNLMRKFIELRIKPYYIHHPDRARGTSHFYVDIDFGRVLMRELLNELSGVCQPTYVIDSADTQSKTRL